MLDSPPRKKSRSGVWNGTKNRRDVGLENVGVLSLLHCSGVKYKTTVDVEA